MRRALFSCLLLYGGCGSASAPISPTHTAMPASPVVLALAVDPSPVVSADQPGSASPLAAAWTVIVTVRGGVGGNVNFINATLRDATSGAEAEPSGIVSLGPGDIIALAGTNHVAPGGSLAVPQGLQYDLPSGGRHGTLRVAVQFSDDGGHILGQTIQTDVE